MIFDCRVSTRNWLHQILLYSDFIIHTGLVLVGRAWSLSILYLNPLPFKSPFINRDLECDSTNVCACDLG